MRPWLVILAAPLDAAGVEVLRIAVGALAAGATVHVLVADRVRALLDAGDVPPGGDDYLRTLRATATWESLEATDWRRRLGASDYVLRHADPERAGTPGLFVVDELALEAPNAQLAERMLAAGQVVRMR